LNLVAVGTMVAACRFWVMAGMTKLWPHPLGYAVRLIRVGEWTVRRGNSHSAYDILTNVVVQMNYRYCACEKFHCEYLLFEIWYWVLEGWMDIWV